MFDHADLAEVAETLARYRAGPVRLGSSAAAGPRITAGVPIERVESFIDLLPDAAAVRVRRNGAAVVLSTR